MNNEAQLNEMSNVDMESFIASKQSTMARIIWNRAMEIAASRIEDRGYIIAADQIRELKK